MKCGLDENLNPRPRPVGRLDGSGVDMGFVCEEVVSSGRNVMLDRSSLHHTFKRTGRAACKGSIVCNLQPR